MSSRERWERVETIYHAVLEREPDDRAAFLNEACRGDEELRTEVDSLLQFDGQATKFIETPALELEAKAIAAETDLDAESMRFKDIGPYHLVSIISHGGMGDVFLAIDTRLDRRVAIKLLSTEFTGDEERIFRFKQEARTTSTLSHPNIVTLFEVGEIDGHHYLVTEFVEGETLRERINNSLATGLNLKDALSIATQIVDALHAAHQAGVIHRDIKPENIILRKDGLVKVLDFGIAKLAAERSDSSADHLTTKTGIIMGTASYMSPEQARGQKVDHRTDIFSVGAVLHEMVSGARPFEGDTMADVMAAVLIKEPKRLNLLVPNVPQSLQRIVNRCLEKQPDQRFQTASDLAFSLKELSGAIAPITPVESAATAFEGKLPRRSLTIAAIVVGIVVVALAILTTSYSDNPTVNRPAVAIKEPHTQPAAKFTTRLVWFDRSGIQLGTVGPLGEYSGPALSPNEDRIVVAIRDPKTHSRDLWVFPIMSESGIRLTEDPADDLNPVWTPDGKWIIYTSDKGGVRNIYRRLADGSGAGEPLLESKQQNNVEDISTDGRLVIFNTRDGEQSEPNLATLSLLNLRSKRFRVIGVREDQGHISPDGHWVAYRSQETKQSEIFVRGITASGDPSNQNQMVSSGGGGNTQPMWRGDGKMLYYLDGKTLTAVEVNSSRGQFRSGPRTALFDVKIEDEEHRNRFLVTKDGQRFLVIEKLEVKQ